MDGIGAAIEAALKWVTDDRKLRTALITIVVFGLLAAALEHYQIAKGISHDWFLSVYAAAVLATLLLTVAVFDLAVVKIYSKYRMSRKKKEWKQKLLRTLVHFLWSSSFMKQQGIHRIVDGQWRMLLDLVILNVLEFRGGIGNATVYEIPQHIRILNALAAVGKRVRGDRHSSVAN